ncbi:beta-ketoacyl-[acyl-carrier-protein] synthase family protein [Desulfovibrio sp. OttesenSCG-928-C06]|nr:beta-ketoacyl-[acyl-carrier-protein] synthase family protein [Desulfovibrio sp. OttesenSCG-928-C06]
MRRDIWITGLGCVCAAGRNVEDSLRALYAGERPQAVPDFLRSMLAKHGDTAVNPVCAVPDTWIGDNWRRGSTHDSSVLLGMAADEAVASASLASLPARVGVCIGTTAGCALHFLDDYGKIRTGSGQICSDSVRSNPACSGSAGSGSTSCNPACPEAAASGAASSCVDSPGATSPGTAGSCASVQDFYNHSMAHDLAALLASRGMGEFSGPVLTISNACTSGADAIAMGAEWIRQGLCDVVFAGGTDALSVVPYIGFNKLMIYSPEPCKPFDAHRAGLNLGEGAGVLVLESAAHAEKRGVRPQGLLKGWGAASDAHHMTAPHPDGRGLRKALDIALDRAGAKPGDIAFINAHGTSTPENDRIESAVYSDLFSNTLLWASKGTTGHCLGGAGALEAVFSICALNRGSIPASVGCVEPEPGVASMISRQESAFGSGLALSVSLGFGGSNAALVFGKVEQGV